MKIKNKRVLKNGAVAAYVYYKNEKKWKWRIIGRQKQKGGEMFEAGSEPIFVPPDNSFYISGLLDCIGIVIKNSNGNGVIAGHFVTQDMLKMDIKRNFNMETRVRTVNIKVEGLQEAGKKFFNTVKYLIEKHNFSEFTVEYYISADEFIHETSKEAYIFLNKKLYKGKLFILETAGLTQRT